MRILALILFMPAALHQLPLQAQWASPTNPTGLPLHLLKPAVLPVSAGEISYRSAITERPALLSLLGNLRHQGQALFSKQADALFQVRRKLRYGAGDMAEELTLPV
jgi:hypothetical protein